LEGLNKEIEEKIADNKEESQKWGSFIFAKKT
jgi:hypothetical protein